MKVDTAALHAGLGAMKHLQRRSQSLGHKAAQQEDACKASGAVAIADNETKCEMAIADAQGALEVAKAPSTRWRVELEGLFLSLLGATDLRVLAVLIPP